MLHICLFGRFSAQCGEQNVAGLDARKVQELFCYLLLHHDRPHAREKLAELLWTDGASRQSKAYLRKAMWQLQSALASPLGQASNILQVELEAVQLNLQGGLWLDVATFEHAYALVHGIRGRDLDSDAIQGLQAAIDLYRGELLEGWYQEWCLYDRERLQQMYLGMLDKLMGYCEAHQSYEAGVAYGGRILGCEPARETTHRRLMRLYYLAGDRSSALRQYERCAAILERELRVPPDEATLALCEQIRANRLDHFDALTPVVRPPDEATNSLREILQRLHRFRATLDEAQRQLHEDIRAVEHLLNQRQQ